MTATRIVLVTTDFTYEHRLRAAYAGVLNGDLRTLSDEVLAISAAQAVEAIATGPGGMPEVVVLGPGLPREDVLDLARRFDVDRPEISVVLIAPPSAELWATAARAGVRDVVDPDTDSSEVFDVIERAREIAVRRRSALAPLAAPVENGPFGRVITVVSPKGGSGKTTMATNLAVGLSRAAPGEVVVVDLDLQFGDVADAFQIVPEHSIADAAQAADNLDATTLKVLLTPTDGGLYVLCAPTSPVQSEQIPSAAVTRVIRSLAEHFRYIVVDTSAGLTEFTLSALEESTDVALVCSMDVTGVRSLRKVVVALDELGMTTQQRHLVLNRADSRVGIEVSDVEATLGLPVDVSVPSSRAVPLSSNQGTPLLASDARHPVSQELHKLVARFVEQPAPRRGVLARWRSAR